MPGVHKNKTISFRPNDWERMLIEEKVRISGKSKKDYISHSCIYSNICIVGNKNNIYKIIEAIQEMQYTMETLASGFTTGKCLLHDDTFNEMSKKYIALCVALVEILNAASYLYNVDRVDDKIIKEVKQNENYLQEVLERLKLD